MQTRGKCWIRGNATLRHGRRKEVHLEEVVADRRAPVLKAYLKRAPGARPHLPIDKDAPLAEFDPGRTEGTWRELAERQRLPYAGAMSAFHGQWWAYEPHPTGAFLQRWPPLASDKRDRGRRDPAIEDRPSGHGVSRYMYRWHNCLLR